MMKVETVAELLDWTRSLHHTLAECLSRCAPQTEDMRLRWLLSYLASHEFEMERIVAGFAASAEASVLNTWIYDYFEHPPMNPEKGCNLPFAGMSFDEAEKAVLELHNHVIDTYRVLAGRVEAVAARELIERLIEREQAETQQLAQQIHRIRDM